MLLVLYGVQRQRTRKRAARTEEKACHALDHRSDRHHRTPLVDLLVGEGANVLAVGTPAVGTLPSYLTAADHADALPD